MPKNFIRNLTAVLMLFCCTLLANAPVYAQNADIDEAVTVVNEFYRLRLMGDIEASRELVTDYYRIKDEEAFAAIGITAKYIMALMQASEYEIKSAEQQDHEIHVSVIVSFPDADIIYNEAGKNLSNNLNHDEYLQAWTDNAAKLAQSGNIPYTHNTIQIILIKKDGHWKIDHEIHNN